MKRRPAIPFITHGLSLLLGLCIAAALSTRSGRPEDGTAAGSGRSGNTAAASARQDADARPAREGKGARGSAALSSADYRQAWKAIGSRELTIQQRLELQMEVLKEWSRVDMEGAMLAALEVPWDGGREKGGIAPLMGAFDEVFRSRPLEAWDLMQSGKLGLGARLFQQQWITSATDVDPVFVFSVAKDIHHDLRMSAIQGAMRSAARSPELKEQMLRKLEELPEGGASDNYISIAFDALPASTADAPAVRGKLAAATNERAKTLLLHEYAAAMREADASTLLGDWAKLPPDMKKRAAVAFLNGSQGGINTPAVIEMLMETGQWERMPQARQKLETFSRETTDPKGLADWALSLPEKPEAEAIFRRSLEPLINRDNNAAQEWIGALPSGPRTDQALYQYVQNALYARNDPVLYQWALGLITDPRMKENTTRSYQGWRRWKGLGPE